MNEGKNRNKHEEWFVQQLKEKDAIIDGISDVLMLLDAKNYKILEVNQAFLNSYGTSREAVFGKSCYDITHQLNIPCHHANSQCPCPLEDTVSTGEASQAEHVHHDHEGKTLYFEIITYPLRDSSGRVTRCIHLSRDITLRKNLENRYHQLALQTEKMSGLGRMAAGIAHEINNPMAGILLYSTNMMKKVPEEGPLKEGLEIIIHETLRCRTIIQDLLEFSREREPKKISANINDIIEKGLRILDNEFRLHHISVEKHLSREIPDNLVDVNQMEQVFVNLLLNAIEATQGKGRITVRSHMDPDQKLGRVEISDTGCGIPAENISKIFEPFFSTKAKGTGLGLAVSYGIVRSHQGDIKVSSQPGQGTCFTIEIPLSE
ncbi:MAG: PAS domain-containing protein [Desulfobacteraceae bacterium]|nr:PAS domain-containing protein [Desulfobacteraceae bacterium]